MPAGGHHHNLCRWCCRLCRQGGWPDTEMFIMPDFCPTPYPEARAMESHETAGRRFYETVAFLLAVAAEFECL